MIALFVLDVAVAGAENLADRAKNAAQSGDMKRLTSVVRETAGILGGSDSLSAGRLEIALAALGSAQSGLRSLRDGKESKVANDEEGLERLYGSAEWSRIDQLDGEIDYWRGWVLYRLGNYAVASKTGEVRARAYFRQSLRGFGRALPRIRDPDVGRETLLAVAALQRLLGEYTKAEGTLLRLGKVFADAPVEFHRRVNLEHARTAAGKGDLDLVIRITKDVQAATDSGQEMLMLRLEAILAKEMSESLSSALAVTVRLLIDSGESTAGQTVALLAHSKLDPKRIRKLGLGAIGFALEGLAYLKQEGAESQAASNLDRALNSGQVLSGLRRDVLFVRLAEARLREGRYDLAWLACDAFRLSAGDSPIRGDVAQLGYEAARSWSEGESSNSKAKSALVTASAWVRKDAPGSVQAGEATVRRALARAVAVRNPRRAIRILERVELEAPGSEAVELQKVFLLSGQLQLALEESLHTSVDLGPIRLKLANAMSQAKKTDTELVSRYEEAFRLADARYEIASGKIGVGLRTLLNLPTDFETVRTRLIALWRIGRRADAQVRAHRLVRKGPGKRKTRWELAALFASVPPEDVPNAVVHARLLNALRSRPPSGADPELLADLALREAQAKHRGGGR